MRDGRQLECNRKEENQQNNNGSQVCVCFATKFELVDATESSQQSRVSLPLVVVKDSTCLCTPSSSLVHSFAPTHSQPHTHTYAMFIVEWFRDVLSSLGECQPPLSSLLLPTPTKRRQTSFIPSIGIQRTVTANFMPLCKSQLTRHWHFVDKRNTSLSSVNSKRRPATQSDRQCAQQLHSSTTYSATTTRLYFLFASHETTDDTRNITPRITLKRARAVIGRTAWKSQYHRGGMQ